MRYGINISGGPVGLMAFFEKYAPSVNVVQISISGLPTLINDFNDEGFNKEFKQFMKDRDLSVFVHGPCAFSPNYSKQAILTLNSYLSACSNLGIDWLVIHSGSWKDNTKAVQSWCDIFSKVSPYQHAKPLLENMSYKVGAMTAAQMNEICEKTPMRLCFDTAHDWVGGNDMSDINPDYVKLVHFNNTSEHRWSGRDRHSLNHVDQGIIDLPRIIKRFPNSCFVSEFACDDETWDEEVQLLGAFFNA